MEKVRVFKVIFTYFFAKSRFLTVLEPVWISACFWSPGPAPGRCKSKKTRFFGPPLFIAFFDVLCFHQKNTKKTLPKFLTAFFSLLLSLWIFIPLMYPLWKGQNCPKCPKVPSKKGVKNGIKSKTAYFRGYGKSLGFRAQKGGFRKMTFFTL